MFEAVGCFWLVFWIGFGVHAVWASSRKVVGRLIVTPDPDTDDVYVSLTLPKPPITMRPNEKVLLIVENCEVTTQK